MSSMIIPAELASFLIPGYDLERDGFLIDCALHGPQRAVKPTVNRGIWQCAVCARADNGYSVKLDQDSE